jgi:hypothetical protein
MIYRFRSRNDADVVMTQPVAERVLQAIGKDVSPEGIVTTEQMAGALAALQAAVAADETTRSGRDDDAHDGDDRDADRASAGAGADAVSLRRRVWPLVEMIRRAQADGTPVTWHA